MPRGDVETLHRDGVWLDHTEDGESLPVEHSTEQDAVEAVREVAGERKVEHIIRDLGRRDRRAQHLRTRPPRQQELSPPRTHRR